MRKETAIYASVQTSGAYASNRGDSVRDRCDRVHCKSIFKDSTSIRMSLSALWVKVINQLEQAKYISGIESDSSARYNEDVQSRDYHNQKIEVSDQ